METTIPQTISSPPPSPFKQAVEQRNKTKPVNNWPLIAIVGESATGKSRSIVNLPVGETAILNVENKTMSFPNPKKFGDNLVSDLKSHADVESWINRCYQSPEIKYVVIDSLAKYFEQLEMYTSTFKWPDSWNILNSTIATFLETIKSCGPKFVIVTALPELVKLPQPNGAEINSRRIWVPGKKWEGKIEKEFTIVLYTDPRRNQTTNTTEYKFTTNTDGYTSAKSPEGMFPEGRIDNDLNLVCERVKKFCQLT